MNFAEEGFDRRETACEAWRTPAVNANMFRKSGITEYTSKEPAEIIKSFVGSAESAPRALVLDDDVFRSVLHHAWRFDRAG